jgi:hypothetical protein
LALRLPPVLPQTVHENLVARGPSSGCLGLGGCFAVGQSVFPSPDCTTFWGTQQ